MKYHPVSNMQFVRYFLKPSVNESGTIDTFCIFYLYFADIVVK
jgi:hypothetical protein